MNPADEAAVKQAEYNADMARRDAGNLGTEAIANAAQFTTQAEQKLAQGMTILGKTGNLSVDTSKAIESGVSVGAKDTAEFTNMQGDLVAKQTDLQKQIDDINKQMQTASKERAPAKTTGEPIGGPSPYDTLQTQLKDLTSQLGDVTGKLTSLGPGGAALQDIRNPDALLHASGSDLLTMVSTRDQMERDKRTLFRSGENTQVAMVKAGENYDVQAGYAKEAASWNTWTTLLGGGIKLAELGKMFF